MSDIFNLTAETRAQKGTADMRRMRRLENKIPAVIYGAEKEVQSVSLPRNIIKKALENEAFFSTILTLDVAGDKQKVIVKAIQRHPWKAEVLHMDFFRVSAKEKLTMTVPIHFKGEEECPGVKEGGKVSHHMSDLEIACLPADLPEFIQVDISELELDGVIHLTQVKLPKGVELTALTHIEDDATADHAVVAVHIPVIIEEPEEEVAEEAAEGEAAKEGEEAKPSEGEGDAAEGDEK